MAQNFKRTSSHKTLKFSRIFTNFSRKVVVLYCIVSDLTKQNEPTVLVCKETTENAK